MWTVTTSKESDEGTVNTRGPSYKVNIVVEGVKTRGFPDHVAQVSLIATQGTLICKQGEAELDTGGM